MGATSDRAWAMPCCARLEHSRHMGASDSSACLLTAPDTMEDLQRRVLMPVSKIAAKLPSSVDAARERVYHTGRAVLLCQVLELRASSMPSEDTEVLPDGADSCELQKCSALTAGAFVPCAAELSGGQYSSDRGATCPARAHRGATLVVERLASPAAAAGRACAPARRRPAASCPPGSDLWTGTTL